MTTYVDESDEDLIVAAGSVGGAEVTTEKSAGIFKSRKRSERMRNWKDKPLHGQFVRQTDDLNNGDRFEARDGITYNSGTKSIN